MLRIIETAMKIIKVRIELAESLPAEQESAFWSNFIEQAIEANGLQYGGLNKGFIEPGGDRPLTARHQQTVEAWLRARQEVKHFELKFTDSGR